MKKIKFLDDFRLVGKSIALNDPNDGVKNSSITHHHQLSGLVKTSMPYCRRINQLYSTVCSHENQLKHEIANHYKDSKNRIFTRKMRQKAKQTLATKVLQRLKKKSSSSAVVATATNAFKMVHRKHRRHRRRFPIKQRQIFQIPSITIPRYYIMCVCVCVCV